MAGKFELYKDKAGKYRFRLKASNGQIIATSSEAYESKIRRPERHRLDQAPRGRRGHRRPDRLVGHRPRAAPAAADSPASPRVRPTLPRKGDA